MKTDSFPYETSMDMDWPRKQSWIQVHLYLKVSKIKGSLPFQKNNIQF